MRVHSLQGGVYAVNRLAVYGLRSKKKKMQILSAPKLNINHLYCLYLSFFFFHGVDRFWAKESRASAKWRICNSPSRQPSSDSESEKEHRKKKDKRKSHSRSKSPAPAPSPCPPPAPVPPSAPRSRSNTREEGEVDQKDDQKVRSYSLLLLSSSRSPFPT